MRRGVDEIFDECIKAIRNNEKTVEKCLGEYGEIDPEFGPMLMAAARLIKSADVAPNMERKQQARTKLLESVEQKQWESGIGRKAQKSHAVRTPRWRAVLLRAGVVAVAIAVLSGTTVALARESLPGSPFYPVKIAVEKARIGLTVDKGKKSKLYLNAAQERISELKRFKQNDVHYQYLLRATAEDIALAGGVSGGSHNREFEESLDDMAQKNREVLEDVLEKAPPSAKPALQRALTNVTRDKGKKKDSNGDNGAEDNNKEPNSGNKSEEIKKVNSGERTPSPSKVTPPETPEPSTPKTPEPSEPSEPGNYWQNKHENDGSEN